MMQADKFRPWYIDQDDQQIYLPAEYEQREEAWTALEVAGVMPPVTIRAGVDYPDHAQR